MASYNISLDNLSPSYEFGWDTSGCKSPPVSPARPFSNPSRAGPSMSPGHLLSNHHLQNSSAPLEPSFLMPAASYNLDLYRPNQDVTHHPSLEGNGAARPFPTDGVSSGFGTTTCAASPSSDCSVQEIPQRNDDGGHCARAGMLCRRRGARRQNSGHGTFRCNWKDCSYPGMFSRKGVLMRHIETQHVTPRSFGCPKCDRLFSRKDNMTEHFGRVHLEIV
ncbi:hypothetical protein N7471_003644 [Penicillium samsonianum]|uniref:uncharacterized protein n=1 Tax=Penicillium samsonianum TaxID=1882272 RepID=UPI0025483EEF|nr:uncharacterized protein N7471_003644 [Penicillium samsonianum]KAJ6137158.1 hypothetical protein N7471_003644 [Penicillium samsonianum]